VFSQDKQIPHFGSSPQVSFEYFSYHLGVSICGIQTSIGGRHFYLTDKLQAGAKTSNHSLNYLRQYVMIQNISSMALKQQQFY